MKKKYLVLVICVLVTCLGIDIYNNGTDKFEYSKKTYENELYTANKTNVDAYINYKSSKNQIFPNQEITIDVTDDQVYTYTFDPQVPDETNAQVDNYTGLSVIGTDADYKKTTTKEGLYIPETGTINFTFDVSEEGFYNIGLYYYTVEGRSGNITKSLLVNNELPFTEAKSFTLSRYWKDSFKVGQNLQDDVNEIRPSAVEEKVWAFSYIKDTRGYYDEPYYVYFNKGVNTITFESIREPMVLNKIVLNQSEKVKSYSQLLNEYKTNNYKTIENTEIKKQGEHASFKSSPTLMPMANYSSNKIEPYVKFITRYNTIGADNWRVAGDSISWDITVEESGLYNLSFKVLQNFNRGMSSTRKLYIDGKLPFAEASNIIIPYESDWQYITLGNGNEDYQFYLEKGTHTITLEASIGVYGNTTRIVDETITELRRLYRDVVMRTGLQPDPYQDYLLTTFIPDLYTRIDSAIDKLNACREDIIRISGERSSLTSSFDRTLYQLKEFKKSEKNIQNGLSEFDNNIASLGTWVMTISEQPLTIDYFNVHGSNHKVPKITNNFFQKIAHEFVLFIGSFSANTQLKSSVETDGPTITVWVTTGRDQSQIIRQMIDESFVVQNNVNVNLQLVSSGLLLNAIAAGVGPDVAIGVAENIPVNYGLRNAIEDLSTYPGFEEFTKNFHESALTPYNFDGKTYALPDTHDFMVSFIRNDIMDEISITDAPDTWDEVIDILPKLQNRYFDYYIPTTQGSLSPVLFAMIQQYGGDLYKGQRGTKEYGYASNFDETNTRDAFLDFTNYFYSYGIPLEANFTNRFRSGETPLGVAQYSTYNTLSVFAPEISGLWSFDLFPGTKKGNEIDYSVTSTTSATIMLKSSKEKDAAWKFMKWWLGEKAQIGYARNMEAILGAAGRYQTANLKAFDLLPWPTKDKIILQKQRQYAKGIPVVPGDYIVGRYIDNAFRDVINNGVNAYDSLFKNILNINEELTRKRKEFDM